MDHAVPTAAPGWRRVFHVPPSKSLHQRALVLAALSAEPVAITAASDALPAGDDTQRCAAAVRALGPWRDGALGDSRASLTLDLGEGATAFRFALALATLRPPGARTLVRG
ncbi:MAG: hypothetical protein O2894_10800, partial [Planctomycetota bacterium]|nr:hypothetical protein [Planctomycetota bacterium]